MVTNDTLCLYMFPGLGADYPNMLAKFIVRYPWAQSLLRRWSEVAGVDIGAAWGEEAHERERARQLEIHSLNLLWWHWLGNRGGQALPNAYGCCGHSLGFYAALVASGALSAEMSFAWLGAVFDLSWEARAASTHKICVVTTTVAHDFEGSGIEVLATNNQTQCVLFGSAADLEALCVSLGDTLLRVDDIGTQIPFHSKTMAPVSAAIGRHVTALNLPVGAPRQSLWSHLSGQRLVTAEDVYETLVTHPSRPVQWIPLVKNLAALGYREFIEIGPNRVLSQIVKRMDVSIPVRFIDHLRREAVAQRCLA